MQPEKHRILAIENTEGRRRTDLRRDYNRLVAGAKAIQRSLSELNERRIFHATHTRVITGRIVDGKIVSDAFTTNPGMLQSYKKTKIPQPLQAWETSGSVVWVPTNDNTVYASPSQFCVANWKKEGIARACNGWRDATTFWWPDGDGRKTPAFVALRDVYTRLTTVMYPLPKKKKKPVPKKKKVKKKKKIGKKPRNEYRENATLWDLITTVKPGTVFVYDPPENIWRSQVNTWKRNLQKRKDKSRIKQNEASIDRIDRQHRTGNTVVTFLRKYTQTNKQFKTQFKHGEMFAQVEVDGDDDLRFFARTPYCYYVREPPIDRTAVRRGDEFTYRYTRRRSWGPNTARVNDLKRRKPNGAVVTYLEHNQKVPPVKVRFPNSEWLWVDWEDLTPLPEPVIAPPPAWTTQQFAHANVRDTHVFNRAEYTNRTNSACRWTEGMRPSKAWMKRVVKDFKFLQKPGTLPKGQAFVVFDDEKLHLLKFMLVPSAPYDGGFFEFDMCIPPDYPARPPLVLIVTTGQGRVRRGNEFPNLGPLSVSGFNPNLYHGGKVCLSILGTFSGPGWDPAVGSIYQVIVSILGLIFGTDCPMKNEPGYHATPAQCKAYNRDLRRAIAKYASVVPSTFAPFVQPTGSASTHPFLRRFLQ